MLKWLKCLVKSTQKVGIKLNKLELNKNTFYSQASLVTGEINVMLHEWKQLYECEKIILN